ncbi:unnamed protein product [Ambrosiozyma monospora]|uniref:Unnamed protein product n=1 Tax=Ambrosiozyma monospora TaxID=43982 RepID=A0ACB5TTK3_AMBMO|nr:unnamed protein product [Ambrosiozyma monospora]
MSELIEEYSNIKIKTKRLIPPITEQLTLFKDVNHIEVITFDDISSLDAIHQRSSHYDTLQYLPDIGPVSSLLISEKTTYLIDYKLANSRLKILELTIPCFNCDFSGLTNLSAFSSTAQLDALSFNTLPPCVSDLTVSTSRSFKAQITGRFKVPKYTRVLECGRKYVTCLDVSNCIQLEHLKFYQGLKGIHVEESIWSDLPPTVNIIDMGYQSRARNGKRRLWGMKLKNEETTSLFFYDNQSYAIYLNDAVESDIWKHRITKELSPYSRIEIVTAGRLAIRADLKLSYVICPSGDSDKFTFINSERRLLQVKDGYSLWSSIVDPQLIKQF